MLPKTYLASSIALVLILGVSSAFGHVTIQPKQSAAGANQTYTIRVPTEKFSPTVRVEVGFPAALNVSSLEPKADWKIEEVKDASGKLQRAILTGSIPTGQSAQFNFKAQNPNEEGALSLKVIQIYEDGSRSEWTGPQGSRTPSPMVEIKRSSAP